MSSAQSLDPLAAPDRITVVSGLPRAGTSLLMQLLEAAGLAIACDDARPPDADNPRGYLELAAVKAIQRDSSFLAGCRGRVVKIVAPLLLALPPDHAYRVLFVERDPGELLASQWAMLRRAGQAVSGGGEAALARAFAATLARCRAWLAERPAIDCLFVEHRALLQEPLASVERIAAFLARTGGAGAHCAARPDAAVEAGARAAPHGQPRAQRERLVAMTRVIDPALYRQRR